MPVKVNEIFESLQGESSYSGFPCLFIRLTGCNLRCGWCDTEYAYFSGKEYENSEIVGIINSSKIQLVEFTGGEPLLQKEELLKIIDLVRPDKTILLETNGSISLEGVQNRVIKVVDIKLGGSGEAGSFLEENLKYIEKKDEIKFVLSDLNDYNELKNIYGKFDLGNLCGVLVSRVAGSEITDRAVADALVRDRLNIRFQVQLHKYIWKDEKGR